MWAIDASRVREINSEFATNEFGACPPTSCLPPMKIWIAGEIEEVKRAAATGLVSAVVTNPAVMARCTAHGQKMEEVCADVCSVTALPLYVQLRGPTTGDFLREWEHLSKFLRCCALNSLRRSMDWQLRPRWHVMAGRRW